MQPSACKRPVVLIVEDEFLVRMDTRATLETDGFDVLEAGDADEAIAIFRAATIFVSSLPTFTCQVQWTG